MTEVVSHSDYRPRPLRVLTPLFLCVGVVFVALLTGDDPPNALARRDPMGGFFPPEMPRYPEARMVPAGESRVSGMTSRIAYFMTKHDPAKVADYYAGVWRRQKLWVRQSVTHRGGVVAAVDAEKALIYQVLLSVRRGETLVFPSVTDAPKKAQSAQTPSPVALYPKSTKLLDTVTRAGPKEARLLVSVNQGTVEENRTHYAAALAAAGYREDRRRDREVAIPEQIAKTIKVYRNRQGAEITVVMTAVDEQETRVHLTMVGSR